MTATEIARLDAEFSAYSDTLRAEFDAKAESINRWLDTQLGYYERRAAALSDSISELTELGSVIDSAMSAVRDNLGTTEADYAYSAAGINALAAAVAAGGALPSADELERYTGGLGDASSYYGNAGDYLIDQAAISRSLSLLGAEQAEQLSDAERLLAGIDAQKEQAQRNHDAMLARTEQQFEVELAKAEEQHSEQVKALESQLAAFEEQVDLLRNIDASVPSLEAAIAQMRSAIETEQRATRSESAEKLEQLTVMLSNISKYSEDTAEAVSDLVNELRGAA